jgi:hypothetical protein
MMRASEALDEVIRGERAWLDLTILRLFTHPGFASIFAEFLVQVYHEMHTATALMEAARTRSAALATSCPVAARLVSRKLDTTSGLRMTCGSSAWTWTPR